MTAVAPLPGNLDEQTELAVLQAATLANRSDLLEATNLLHPEDFTYGRHRTVWEAFTTLTREAQPLEAVTVADRLEHHGHLDDAGGLPALLEIWSRASHGAGLLHHARRVHDHAIRRRVHHAAQQLAAALTDPTRDVAETVHNGFEQLLDQVRGVRPSVRGRDLAEPLWELWEAGPPDGTRSGWTVVDDLFRPLPGEIAVLTGVPSHGKSTWLDALIVRWIERHGWRACYYTPERYPRETHGDRLITTHAGGPARDLDARLREQSIDWLDKHVEWIDDDAHTSLPAILSSAEIINDRAGVDVFVIDPWARVEAVKPHDMKLTEYIGIALTQLTRFAQRNDVLVVIVAHPKKLSFHPKHKLYDVPRPYDISESANWFNLPSWCLAVWRDHLAPGPDEADYKPDRDPELVDVHVQKVRDDYRGRVGVASLRFRSHARTYHELAQEAL